MPKRFSTYLRKPAVAAGGLFILALLVRLLFLMISGFYGQIINNDAHAYKLIAENLLAGHGFALGPEQPTTFRPFGYPLLLAVVYGGLGTSVVWVQLVQAFMGGLSVLLTYLIARRFVQSITAVLVGVGAALHPILLYLTALVAPGAVATFLQLCLLWLVLAITERDGFSWRSVLGFALTGALAILMRPELLVLPWLLAVGYLLYAGLTSVSSKALIVAVVLATSLAIVPVAIRNYLVFDAFIPLPTIGGATFWGANNSLSDGGWVMASAETWTKPDPPQGMQGWPNLTEQENQERFYAASWSWISDNPKTALSLIPRKLVRSWSLSYADEAKANSLPPVASVLHGLFIFCSFVGMIFAWQRYKPYRWLLFAPVVAWLVKTVIFYGSARQTAIVLPILCLFVGVVIEVVAKRFVSVEV